MLVTRSASIRCELRTKLPMMEKPTSHEPESARLACCARLECRRQFSACGPCDHGRRYCGAECASAARRDSLRRAGRAYQRTHRGSRLHATRQARYRERLARVTHQRPSEALEITTLPVQTPTVDVAVAGLAVRLVSVGTSPAPKEGAKTVCLVCGRGHTHHHVGFRAPRRRQAAMGRASLGKRWREPHRRQKRHPSLRARATHPFAL
jgi:hypothetical protein